MRVGPCSQGPTAAGRIGWARMAAGASLDDSPQHSPGSARLHAAGLVRGLRVVFDLETQAAQPPRSFPNQGLCRPFDSHKQRSAFHNRRVVSVDVSTPPSEQIHTQLRLTFKHHQS